ncbi:MAG: 50S ribosomal protein L16 [Thaumarchaeota archaeon]|nr:50S ribosomal protein L16 [Nitrososphaerota archaeon]|tara:strand:- start:1689 stop:2174 length:486 start_codon:yes stop_codon:yes gene_type:complete
MNGSNYRTPNGMPLSKKYAPGTPDIKIARFNTGASNSDYNLKLQLISKEKSQIRDNAIEAARVSANKSLTKHIGETSYRLSVKLYPHVVISENRMLATAGADRLQEGMRRAYGKPIGLAARVNIGSVILEVNTYKEFFNEGKNALKTASSKLPQTTSIATN